MLETSTLSLHPLLQITLSRSDAMTTTICGNWISRRFGSIVFFSISFTPVSCWVSTDIFDFCKLLFAPLLRRFIFFIFCLLFRLGNERGGINVHVMQTALRQTSNRQIFRVTQNGMGRGRGTLLPSQTPTTRSSGRVSACFTDHYDIFALVLATVRRKFGVWCVG